ncbi:MAG: DUF1667 domain-containing protein [Clostridia bacterium]|nr:DUF1667 domain-containing protein [Clostridia bacterium]
MNTICIMCPMGCPLHIEEVNGEVVVTGNTCKRGQIYGVEEFTHPKRAITTLVKTVDGGVVSVKTSNTVPKERIFDVVAEIGKLTAGKDAQIGDVLAKDVLGLGVDVIITGTAKSGVR